MKKTTDQMSSLLDKWNLKEFVSLCRADSTSKFSCNFFFLILYEKEKDGCFERGGVVFTVILLFKIRKSHFFVNFMYSLTCYERPEYLWIKGTFSVHQARHAEWSAYWIAVLYTVEGINQRSSASSKEQELCCSVQLDTDKWILVKVQIEMIWKLKFCMV